MSATITGICDAVAAALNATPNDWTLEFTAVRRYRARWNSVELASLQVAVVLGPVDFEVLNRERDKETVTADIVFAQAGDPDDNTQIDPIVAQMKQLATWFRHKELVANGTNIICVGRGFVSPENAMVDPRMLSQERTIVLVLRTEWVPRK